MGGVETMSDVPIRFSREVRKRMIKSQKAKGLPGYLALLKGLKLADLAPELPAIAEYSTGACPRLARGVASVSAPGRPQRVALGACRGKGVAAVRGPHL